VWYVGQPTTATGVTGNTYTLNTTTAGILIYTVVDSATTTGCKDMSASNVLTVTVTVNDLPTPPVLTAPTGTNNAYCQGLPTPLTVNSGTSTAVWYSNNTVVNLGSTYTPPANLPAGTYTYSVIDSVAVPGGCTSGSQLANTTTLTVTVYPTPSLNLTGAALDTAACGQLNGGVHNISAANVSNGTLPYTYQWYNATTGLPIAGAIAPSLTGQPAGNYSLQVTDANGCVATNSGGPTTFSVPAIAQPTALFSTTPSPATGSVPLNVVFTNQSVNIDTTKTTYVWIFGDNNTGGIAHDTSHTYTATGTYTVT